MAGRPRIHPNNAAKQAAYRARKRQERRERTGVETTTERAQRLGDAAIRQFFGQPQGR